MSPSQINTHLCLSAHMTSDVTASPEENTCCRYRHNTPAEWPHRDVITPHAWWWRWRTSGWTCQEARDWLIDLTASIWLVPQAFVCTIWWCHSPDRRVTWSVCEKQEVPHLSCFSNFVLKSARKGRLCFYFGRFCRSACSQPSGETP